MSINDNAETNNSSPILAQVEKLAISGRGGEIAKLVSEQDDLPVASEMVRVWHQIARPTYTIDKEKSKLLATEDQFDKRSRKAVKPKGAWVPLFGHSIFYGEVSQDFEVSEPKARGFMYTNNGKVTFVDFDGTRWLGKGDQKSCAQLSQMGFIDASATNPRKIVEDIAVGTITLRALELHTNILESKDTDLKMKKLYEKLTQTHIEPPKSGEYPIEVNINTEYSLQLMNLAKQIAHNAPGGMFVPFSGAAGYRHVDPVLNAFLAKITRIESN